MIEGMGSVGVRRLTPLSVLVLLACHSSGARGSGTDAGEGDAGMGADADDGGSPCSGAPGGSPMTIPLLPSGARLSGVQNADGGATGFQTLTNTVTVPAGCYASASLRFSIKTGCVGAAPPGQNWPAKCDPFDRLSRVTLADPGQTPLILLDAVTPFGADATWTADVTDYVPALTGTHTIAAYISSYATADGQASGTDAGFDVDVTLTLTPGVPPRDVIAVVPIWRQSIDPTTGPLTSMIAAPDGAAHARLDFFTTGHGAKGSLMECDEFCMKPNTVTVDGAKVYAKAPWKDCSNDCTHTTISGTIMCGGQTFDYGCKENPTSCPSSPIAPRANWCPAQPIAPFALSLDDSIATGTHSVGLSIAGVEGNFEVGLAAVFWR